MNILISSPQANVFSLLAIAKQQMILLDRRQDVSEMVNRATKSNSYEQAVDIINEYLLDKINIIE